MPFSAILLVFKFLMFSFLQVCKFTDLQVHNSIDCPYFYGVSVKKSDLLHLTVYYMTSVMRNPAFNMYMRKQRRSLSVPLFSLYRQFLFLLNIKFQAISHLL